MKQSKETHTPNGKDILLQLALKYKQKGDADKLFRLLETLVTRLVELKADRKLLLLL